MSKSVNNFPHVDLSTKEYEKTAYEQAKKGLKVYKQTLDPLESGRDWLKMQSEELIDAHQYLVAEMEKRKFIVNKIRNLIEHKSEWGSYEEIMHWLDELGGTNHEDN